MMIHIEHPMHTHIHRQTLPPYDCESETRKLTIQYFFLFEMLFNRCCKKKCSQSPLLKRKNAWVGGGIFASKCISK